MDNFGITILNVDGSEISLYAKSRILREAGYRIIEARSGAEALRLAKRESPQLVLLSADLPDWSGFEALGRLKTDTTCSSQSAPPLVLLVSATFVGCEKRALKEDADGYLLEPTTPEFLLANIKMLLRRLPSAVEIARSLADEWLRGRQSMGVEGGVEFALIINSAESLDDVLRIAAREARELIGARQAKASLNSEALDPDDRDLCAGEQAAAYAVSFTEKYAKDISTSGWPSETWFSSLVCRLNQPMRLTQAELESQLDWRRDPETRQTDCHPHALKEVATPQELEALRQMACLREVAGMREVATPREIADLRKAAATRNPQILRGLDMRGWLAAPLISRADGCGRNLGLIQLSDKYDGEFTAQDEMTLVQFARIVSIAVENRLRWRHEQRLREMAERAARAKDEFMAMASYNLRAQLNILLGWSWVLRRQAGKTEDVTRAAEIIERAARNQARLVEEILGASRKGAVIWREGGTGGRRDGDIAGRREGETELWRDGTAEEQWDKKTGEWEEGGTLDLSISPSLHLSLTPSLRATVHRSPNSTSRGLAAGGGR